jgi:hypothetical protein
MLLFAGPLGLWGAWAAWSGLAGGDWISGLVGVGGIITAAGLLRLHAWARYLAYLFAAGLSLSWLYVVWQVGSRGWPFGDWFHTLISLVPGACLLVICAGGSYVVHRQYARRAG